MAGPDSGNRGRVVKSQFGVSEKLRTVSTDVKVVAGILQELMTMPLP